MVCLIKSKYKEELDQYTGLLGSEKRAYAILCCNNGYTLDKTKDGKPSKLYNDLLEYYKGDVTKATQKKAQLFTSDFTNDYGEWFQDGYKVSDEYKDVFDENGEPVLHDTYFGTLDNKISLEGQYDNDDQIRMVKYQQLGNFHSSNINDDIYDELPFRKSDTGRNQYKYNRERAVEYIKNQGYNISNLRNDPYETRFEVSLQAKNKKEIWRSYIENMNHGLRVKYRGVHLGTKNAKLEVQIKTREADSFDTLFRLLNKKSVTTANDLLQYIINQTKGENNQNFSFVLSVLKDINKTQPGLFDNINVKIENNQNGNYSAKYNANTKTIIINTAKQFANENGFSNALVQTLTHELIHTVTIEALQRSKSLRQKAEKLLVELKKQFKDDPDVYGIQDIYEMVAELSNNEFVNKLQQISYSTKENWLDRIKRFISTLVRNFLQKIGLSYKNTAYLELADIFVQASYSNKTGLDMSNKIDDTGIYYRNTKKRIRDARKKIKTSIQDGLHIIGTRDSSQALIDNLTQRIARGADSKNKAYNSKRNNSVSYGNEKQIARNQEAVDYANEQIKTINEAMAERDAEKQLTEQAKLILDFVDRADTDINEVLQMLQNAKDNDYELLYYNTDQFGNRLYQDPSGNSITAKTANKNTVASLFSFDDIQYITTDILGYYSGLLTDIDKMLLNIPQGKNAIIDEIRDVVQSTGLHDRLRAASNMKLQAQEKLLDFYIDQRINQQDSSELTDDMKQRLSINMKKWIRSQYDFGDLSGFQVWTQLVSDSKSPIVRMIADEMYKMNQEINNAVIPVAEQLEQVLKEAENEASVLGNHSPINPMTKLMQKDRRGWYNGDFVQPINRRQYFTDLEDFKAALLFGKGGIEDKLKKLMKDDKFNLELDEFGEPIIPTNSQFDDLYRDYKRKIESFICDHANRRFTKEYYLSRIDILSPSTLRILDQFSKKINQLKNAATINGKFRPDLLSSKQRAALSQLQKERQQLSNPYTELGELKDPDSTEGIIAKELGEWQNKINGYIKYKTDVEAFNECLNNLKTQSEKDQFKRLFSHIGLNPRMFEDLYSLDYIGNDQKVQKLVNDIKDLYKRRNKLIQINKESSSYLGYDWDKLFDITTGVIKNEKLLQELSNIEKELYNKRELLKMIRKYDPNNQKEVDEFKKNWQLKGQYRSIDRFNTMYYGSVNIDPTQNSTQTVYTLNQDSVFSIVFDNYVRYLVDHGMSTQDANKKAADVLTVAPGTPLSLFEVQIPKYKIFKYKDSNGVEREESSFVWVPNQLFSKIDIENSSNKYVNKEFDENMEESVQPKEQYYRDNDYYEMIKHPKLFNLYNQLIERMKDVYEMIPYSGKYDMRLPQIGANTAAILTRNLSSEYGLHIGRNIGSIYNRFINATEIDTDYYIPEQHRRPDGSRIKNIPIRYINRIDDSRNISSDLTGGVIAMLKMANNYKIKSQHISKFESILNSVKENDVSTSNQYRAIEGLLDKELYENQNNSIPALDNLDKCNLIKRIFFGGSKTMLKRLGLVRNASTLINLSCKGVSMIVSFLDPLISTFIESMSGRNYGGRDLMHGIFEVCKEFPQMLASIERRKSYSKTMAIIDQLGMEKSVEHRFANMHHSTLRRLLSDNLGMKGFEIGDYTIKAFNVNSIYRNYRLYTNNNGESIFLNRYDYIQHCIQDGLSKKDAIKAYNSAKAARSYLTVKNGTLSFEGPMTQEEFIKIGNAAKKISQNITLMANSEDKTWLQINPWTAFITMLRTFMIVGFGERFKNFNDFITGTDEIKNPTTGLTSVEISDRNLTKNEIREQKKQHYYRGGYNFMTGHIENGIYISNFKGLSRIIKNALKTKQIFMSFFSKYGNMTQDELKKSDISLQELYALKRICLELGAVVACVTLSVLVNKHCNDLDPDDDDNYLWFLLNSVTMRMGIERNTMYNPQTVSDLITSITTSTSAFSKMFGALEVLGDIIGITDYDPDDIITSDSAYKGYKRSYRATMNALAISGTAGWFATMPKSLGGGGAKALDKSASWYAATAPWRLLYRDFNKTNSSGYKDPDLANDNDYISDLASDNDYIE